VGELRLVLHIPELEVLMADVQQVLDDVKAMKTEMLARFDSIDNILEANQIDQAVVDQISAEVQSGRDRLAAMNPEDPAGDNPPA
jgi:uncharacterized protein YaaN involved in tellurite resistance